MCAHPLKMAEHFAGTPRTDFNSSAEVNSACGKVLLCKTLERATRHDLTIG